MLTTIQMSCLQVWFGGAGALSGTPRQVSAGAEWGGLARARGRHYTSRAGDWAGWEVPAAVQRPSPRRIWPAVWCSVGCVQSPQLASKSEQQRCRQSGQSCLSPACIDCPVAQRLYRCKHDRNAKIIIIRCYYYKRKATTVLLLFFIISHSAFWHWPGEFLQVH